MAHCDLQRVRGYYLQAIESYDIKSLIHEAENRKIVTYAERNELEWQGSRGSMRESFVNLMIKHGVQGRHFILDFSRRAHEEAHRQFELVYEAMLQQPRASNHTASSNNVGSVESGLQTGEGLSQLSQDSSHSSYTSPMECDPEDGGYFSISGITSVCHSQPDNSQPSCTSLDYMEKEFKTLQETHSSFQRHVCRKQPSQLLTLGSPSQSSQAVPMPGTVNIVNNSYVINTTKVDSGSVKQGTNTIEYPGETSTSQLSACDDLSSSCNGSRQRWESSLWKQCLKENHCRIIELLNIASLLPHLWQKGLLTETEWDDLDGMSATPQKQARYLLKILPRKGERGFKQFLECLRDEKEHMGHEELVKIIWLGLCSQMPIEV